MYQPKPINTANIELPSEINELTEILAASTHDVWAVGKIGKGYKFGDVTSDAEMTHADLIPYSELSEDKKDYDRQTAMETLKAIYALGYEIRKRETHDDYPKDRDFVADHNRIDETEKRYSWG